MLEAVGYLPYFFTGFLLCRHGLCSRFLELGLTSPRAYRAMRLAARCALAGLWFMALCHSSLEQAQG